MENRHRARILALKALYSWDINKKTTVTQILNVEDDNEYSRDTIRYSESLFDGVLRNKESIDSIINSQSINWEFSRLGLVDLAILRLSIYSLIFIQEIPKNIIINEAINLSKEYCSDKAYRFINGILDSVNIEVEISRSIKI